MKIQVDSQINIALLEPAHGPSLFALTNKNRAHLKQWLGWLDLVKTLDDTETFIETAIHNHNHGQASTFAIFFQGGLIGLAGLNHLDQFNHWGSIGYWLCQSHSGKGVITKVVDKLLDYSFVEYKLHKIEIRCAADNHKSRAVPERLGFSYEARLRDCEWLYDKYVDHVIYSILSNEYYQTKKVD